MPIPIPASTSHQRKARSTLEEMRGSYPITESPSDFTPVSMPVPLVNTASLSDISLDSLGFVAAQVRDAQPPFSRVEKTLDRGGDMLDGMLPNGGVTTDMTETVQALKSGISTFMHDISWLMRVLDEVAKIHPFVAAPILAFKAVYSMERTRQENDKRIISLYVAMKDMIAVLVELRGIEDSKRVGPDGMTIEARMQGLAREAAGAIKECANACDTYTKKKLVVKVLKGPIWEGKLAEYVARFHDLKLEFHFALTAHTAKAVDGVKVTVDAVHETLSEHTKILHAMFRDLRPQEEAFIEAKIGERGGSERVQESDRLLQELLEYEHNIQASRHKGIVRMSSSMSMLPDPNDPKLRPEISERTMQDSTVFLKDLKDDLDEDWKTAVDKNMTVFQRKYDLHERQVKELSVVIHEENNRTIRELSIGPHDMINDEEIKEIWREMRWRRNVDANRFATTLRDHFKEKMGSVYGPPEAPTSSTRRDEWTNEFIELLYLQRIKEAFDEDGSGYVTVREVNKFTDMQPVSLGWSLRHWLSYCTVGWQLAATRYRENIRRVFALMFDMRDRILPENRSLVDDYLYKIWVDAAKIFESLRPAKPVLGNYEHKFQDYVKHEEDRIMRNLEGIKYNVDALDTVAAVVGPGRLENHIFALLFLLLRHDLALFRVAQERSCPQLDQCFAVSANSLLQVYEAFNMRYSYLSTLLVHNSLEVGSNIKRFACELFEYYHAEGPMWKAIHVQIALDDETIELHAPDDLAIAMSIDTSESPAPISSPVRALSVSRELPSSSSEDVLPPLAALLGEWNGFVYSRVEYPLFLMTSFVAYPSTMSIYDFEARGMHYGASYRLYGTCGDVDGHIRVTFSIHYSLEFRSKYFSGYLMDNMTITGTEGWASDPSTHQYRFVLKRIPATYLCFRPPPVQFRRDRVKALWRFACSAALHIARTRLWSWSLFAQRRRTRRSLIEYDIRNYTSYGRPLDAEERARWTLQRGSITAVDASFYRYIRDKELRLVPTHPGAVCGGCKYQIRGARIICIDCLPTNGDYSKSLDFCDDQRCLATRIKGREFPRSPHSTAHELLKVRSTQHVRDMYWLEELARRSLAVARRTLNHSVASASFDDDDDLYLDEENPTAPDIDPEQYSKPKSPAASPVLRAFSRRGRRPPPRRKLSHSAVSCHTCSISIDAAMGCWFCAYCFEDGHRVFLCDACEAGTLLACTSCAKPYRQPSWYHGTAAADPLVCSKCALLSAPKTPVAPGARHTYTHGLVRCKPSSDTVHSLVAMPQADPGAEMRQQFDLLDQRMVRLMQMVETALATAAPRL